MVKKTLLMLSMISILAGPMLYLSVVDKIGGGAGPSFKMPSLGLPDWLESGSEQVIGTAGEMAGDSGATIYKWKDAAGVWQFANELPVGVTDAETVLISSNTSLQAFKPQAEPEQEKDEAPAEAKQEESVELDLIPTPGRVKKLIEDAQNVQNVLDERLKQMDSLSAE